MAPKKAAGKAHQNSTNGEVTTKSDGKQHDASSSSKQDTRKRKAQDTPVKEPAKTSRRSSRTNAPSKPDPIKLVNFLLSAEALPLCRPKDESADLESRPKGTRTYSTSPLSPFEELAAALILSRPIGHMLGLRSIRTLFNDPHQLNTPVAIQKAGKDGCWTVLDNARTQHKQKTAEELVLLAEAVKDHLGKNDNDVDLQALRETSGKNVEQEREMLKKHVKGVAKTGIDIFGRRIQSQWEEWYPFLDDRSVQALASFGLESDADQLKDFLDAHWDQVEQGQFGEEGDALKRKVFAKVAERALGAGLEGNVEAVARKVGDA